MALETILTIFKQAGVTPLLKKPSVNPSQVESYQMVLILEFLSKAIKIVFIKPISDFLSLNYCLALNRPSFKSSHSTETALLSASEALRSARASAQSSVLILLDLSAAFDTVSHHIPLSLLSDMGIWDKVHSPFKSNHTGRCLNGSR